MDSKNGKFNSSDDDANVRSNSLEKTFMNSNSHLSSEDALSEESSVPKSASTIRTDDGIPYRANGSMLGREKNPSEIQAATGKSSQTPTHSDELQRAKNTNTKVAKTAAKKAATYLGGPIGSKVADGANKTGFLDSIYDKISKAGKFNPLAHRMQKKLNKADDAGINDNASFTGSTESNALADTKETAEDPGSGNKVINRRSKGARPLDGSNSEKKDANVDQNTTVDDQKSYGQGLAKKKIKNSNKKKGISKNAKGKLFDFIKKHPVVLIGIGGAGIFFILFIILMSFLLGGGGYAESEIAQGTLDTRYDFNQISVTLTNSYNSEQDRVQIQQLMFEDLIKGATYAELYNSVEGLSKNQMIQLFSTNMIVFRALALNIGDYDSSTMEIEIQSGVNGIPYCDINNGCDIINKNGINTFVISSYNGNFTGDKISSIPKAEGDVYQALNEAYEKTKYLILVPKTVNELLTKYDYGNPPYTQSIKERFIKKANNNKDYETIIKEVSEYVNYKIYNLETFAMNYNYSNNNSYWWPIGGKQDNSGLYSGITSWTKISSPYGPRIHPITGKQSFHTGIDIPASQGTPIIATRSGKVTIATYNSVNGNYVEINHGDGTSSRYAHMMNGGILVKVGQTVTQGQIIGKVGTTGASTGNHLHFEIRIDGKTVNPIDYVNINNQRPKAIASNGSVVGVKGSNNTQSVCLTLKSAGFSNNAVAALMSNMHHESGFRISALGDSGTSYGLCQWHNGRYTNLRNYCGSRLNTVECQVDYLIYELKRSYHGVYNNLLSNATADSMTTYFCMNFERPANKNVTCPNRARSTSSTYLNYVNNGCK